MKSTLKTASRARSNDLAPEYQFDYSKAKPNRFAGQLNLNAVVVLLAPDVAKIFKDGDSVNNALRAVITAFPRRKASK